MRASPRIDGRYWTCLVAASILGTNTGDFVAGRLGMGHLAGLPYLLLLFIVLLLLEARSRRDGALYFWAAIITVRTAATNVGDAFRDFGIGLQQSVPLVLAVFLASVLAYRRMNGRAAGAAMRVNGAYWACMMLAGILGTVGGDLAANLQTEPRAAFAFLMLAGAAIAWYGRKGILPGPLSYWLIVALIRTGGTAAGDALAHSLGLPLSTVATGLVFVGLIAFFYAYRPRLEAKAVS